MATTMQRFDAAAFLGELLEPGAELGQAATAEPLHLASETANIRPHDLPEQWRELYEERAAIREADGGQAREHAEAEALREIVAMMQGQSTP